MKKTSIIFTLLSLLLLGGCNNSNSSSSEEEAQNLSLENFLSKAKGNNSTLGISISESLKYEVLAIDDDNVLFLYTSTNRVYGNGFSIIGDQGVFSYVINNNSIEIDYLASPVTSLSVIDNFAYTAKDIGEIDLDLFNEDENIENRYHLSDVPENIKYMLCDLVDINFSSYYTFGDFILDIATNERGLYGKITYHINSNEGYFEIYDMGNTSHDCLSNIPTSIKKSRFSNRDTTKLAKVFNYFNDEDYKLSKYIYWDEEFDYHTYVDDYYFEEQSGISLMDLNSNIAKTNKFANKLISDYGYLKLNDGDDYFELSKDYRSYDGYDYEFYLNIKYYSFDELPTNQKIFYPNGYMEAAIMIRASDYSVVYDDIASANEVFKQICVGRIDEEKIYFPGINDSQDIEEIRLLDNTDIYNKSAYHEAGCNIYSFTGFIYLTFNETSKIEKYAIELAKSIYNLGLYGFIGEYGESNKKFDNDTTSLNEEKYITFLDNEKIGDSTSMIVINLPNNDNKILSINIETLSDEGVELFYGE